MRALPSLLAALVLVTGAARADGPPAPPEGHPPVVLAEGEVYRAPAGGAVVLDVPAARYQVEKVRWLEVKVRAGEEVAGRQRLKGVVVGLVAGVLVGLVVGAAAHR